MFEVVKMVSKDAFSSSVPTYSSDLRILCDNSSWRYFRHTVKVAQAGDVFSLYGACVSRLGYTV